MQEGNKETKKDITAIQEVCNGFVTSLRNKILTDIHYTVDKGTTDIIMSAIDSTLRSEMFNLTESMRMHHLDNVIPLNNTGDFNNEMREYAWYHVTSASEFNILNQAYRDSLTAPCKYPETICIETDTENETEIYDFHMSKCMEHTKEFWRDLGYDVNIRPIVQAPPEFNKIDHEVIVHGNRGSGNDRQG